MYLWYNFKWKVSKKYVSVLSSTSCQIPENWNSRTIWLVLWRHCLIYRRLKFDFAKATNKLCHICNNATGKGSFQLKCFLEMANGGMFGFSIPLVETRGDHASASFVLANTIFSPGLKAGCPVYGQLAQRKASPR